MSITSADDRRTRYNPVVATTDFAADFPVFDNDDLKVFVDGVERVDFAVTATYVNGIANDAKAVFAVGVTGTVDVVGYRDPHRTNRFVDGAPLPVRDINLALDTLEGEMQEARRDIERAAKVDYGAEQQSIPAPESGKVIGWSTAGKLINKSAADIGALVLGATGLALTGADTPKDARDLLEITPRYATVAEFAAVPILPAIIKEVTVAGYATAGDGGGHRKIRLSAPVAVKPWHTVLADGSMWEIAEQELDTRMFGALAGIADCKTQLQNAIDASSTLGRKLNARGGVIEASGGLIVRSNVVIEWDAATWWKQTAYSSTGAFLTNVSPVQAERAVSNIVLIRPQIDLSAITYDVSNTTNSENCIGFARNARKIWIYGGTVKGARPNFNAAGGYGGKGIGLDGGVFDVMITGTRFESCYIGFWQRGAETAFTNGLDGLEQTTRVSVTNVHFEDCQVAIALQARDPNEDPDREAADFQTRIIGGTYHNCGFAPDVPASSANRYKSGIIMLGEAQNVLIDGLTGYNDATYIADKGGWPATGDVIGQGLTGEIGAVVYGWGSNIRITNVTHNGNAENFWIMGRAFAIGDDAADAVHPRVPVCTLFQADHVTVQGTITNLIRQDAYDPITTVANWSARVTNARVHGYTGIINANMSTMSNVFVQVFNSAMREVFGQADWVYANSNTIGTDQRRGQGIWLGNRKEWEMTFAANGQQSIQLPDADGFLVISCATGASAAPVQALVRYRTTASGGAAQLAYWPSNATAVSNFALAVNNTPQTAASTVTVTLSDSGLLTVDNQRGAIGLVKIGKML